MTSIGGVLADDALTYAASIGHTLSVPALKLSNFVADVLPTPGTNGVPDPVTDPAGCATYLSGIRETLIESTKLKPMVRVADANLDLMAELDGELSGMCEELVEDTGKATIVINYSSWLVDWMTNQTHPISDLHLLIDPNPLEQDWRTRWGGKITEIHIKRDDKGVHSVELVALHFREHAKRLLVAANPWFPPEIQLPRMWVLPGPLRTILFITTFINLARLFMPGWSTITNIANPAGWINPLNPDAALNILPTEWPIQVAFVDTVLDQSRWTTVGGTWTTMHETYKDLLTDAGCQMRAYTYLTTDKDSPNTELANILTLAPDLAGMLGIDLSQVGDALADLAAPRRNCVVFAFEQKDGVTGPTGTAADGLLSTVAVTLDDLITPIVVDLNDGTTWDPGYTLNGIPLADAAGVEESMLIRQLTGVAPEPPKVIWWDGPNNGMVNTDLTWHKGAVKTIMTGSKSPTIVNQAQTFAIRYGLSQLSTVVNWWLGIAAQGGQQQVPGTPGLENLYQGQLDNTWLAWQRFTDPIRALHGGDIAWQEHFEKGSGTAYTLSTQLTLRAGDFKTRAFNSFKATPIDGHPWICDYDYRLGDRVGFEQEGVIYVDNFLGRKREWDWTSPMKNTAQIGEDRQRDDPFAAAFKTIANVYSFASQVAGEGTLFG